MDRVGEALPNSELEEEYEEYISILDEQYMAARVSVWWDLQNCHVFEDLDPQQIKENIGSAVARKNYYGPLSIFCYGDKNIIPDFVRLAFKSTGIVFKHVTADEKEVMIIVDMMLWAIDNSAPANILLISDDGEFSRVINRLSMGRYNILLAKSPSPNVYIPSLVVPAKSVWLYTTLFKGGSPLSKGELQLLKAYKSVSAGGSPQPSSKTLQVPASNAHSDAATGPPDSEVHASKRRKMEGVGKALPYLEEEYITSNVSVWWALQNWTSCGDLDPLLIKGAVHLAVGGKNYHGPFSFFCYGDGISIPCSVLLAFKMTGIVFKHFTAGN